MSEGFGVDFGGIWLCDWFLYSVLSGVCLEVGGGVCEVLCSFF